MSPPTVIASAVKPSVEIQHFASMVGFQTCATGSQRMKSNNAQRTQGIATATIKKYSNHLCHWMIVIRRRKIAAEALLVAMPIMQNLEDFSEHRSVLCQEKMAYVWPIISARVDQTKFCGLSSAECLPKPYNAADVHATVYGISMNYLELSKLLQRWFTWFTYPAKSNQVVIPAELAIEQLHLCEQSEANKNKSNYGLRPHYTNNCRAVPSKLIHNDSEGVEC